MLSTTSSTPRQLQYTDLTDPQLAAIDRLYQEDETLLLAGLGFGKAIVGLTALQQLLDGRLVTRVLVLAPKQVCDLTWATEPRKWAHIKAKVAIATRQKRFREKALESGAEIIVCNFENASWVVKNYGDRFDALLIDEITKLKAAGGATTKALRHWVKNLVWRAGMTGTPVAETGADIYAQALLLDLGRALGTRKETFLRTYFYPTDYQQRNWELLPGSAEKISIQLQQLLYCADDTDYKAALPEERLSIVDCKLPVSGVDLYRQVSKRRVIDITGSNTTHTVTIPTLAVRTGKQQQIAAGGLYDDEGDLCWLSDHKIRVLRGLLCQIEQIDQPIIIVYQYSFELMQLRKHIDPHAPVLGAGEPFSAEMQENWNRKSYRYLFMHPKSAAHGLNLQYGTNVMIFLSPLWSADAWAQCLGRIRRRGQPEEVVYRYVLVTDGTIDSEVYVRQELKAHREERLMGMFREVSGGK